TFGRASEGASPALVDDIHGCSLGEQKAQDRVLSFARRPHESGRAVESLRVDARSVLDENTQCGQRAAGRIFVRGVSGGVKERRVPVTVARFEGGARGQE